MQQHTQSTKEAIEGAVSYTVGGGSVAAGWLLNAADYAQAVAIILGCLVVAIRVAYDGVRLYRYIRVKSDEQE